MSDSPRYTAAVAAQTREELAQHPRVRQRRVAHHYTSLVQLALTMRSLIRERDDGGDCGQELSWAINRCEADIAKAHFEAFGAWPAWWLAHEGVEP